MFSTGCMKTTSVLSNAAGPVSGATQLLEMLVVAQPATSVRAVAKPPRRVDTYGIAM